MESSLPCLTAEELFRHYGHDMVKPFLVRYGRSYVPQALPESYRKAQAWDGACRSSYNMARRHGVTYVEGIASTTHRLPFHHVWCVDENGRVLDRQFDDLCAYFGVPFRTEFLDALFSSRRKKHDDPYFGVLDHWQAKWPMETKYADSPELWLADVPGSNDS